MRNVVVVIGAGSIGQAIVRRVSAGKHVVLADLRAENAEAAAKTLTDAGFEVSTETVDVSSRASVHALVAAATALGDVTGVIHAAGVSPPRHRRRRSSRSICTARRSCSNCSATSSQAVAPASSSRRSQATDCRPLSAEENARLATTPTEALLALPMLQPGKVKESLHAYQLSKRGTRCG